MDLATGSAGFLISTMEIMIQDVEIFMERKQPSRNKNR